MKLKFAVFGERDSKSLYCNVRKYVFVFFRESSGCTS